MPFSPLRTFAASLTALALSATALTGLQAPAAAAADTFVPIPGPVFGDPTAESNQILSRLLNNIKHTPRNGTIRIVGYSFSLGRVADALLAAKKRGVHLQIVLDGHSRAWSPSKRLDAALGSDPTQRDYLVLTKGSARGTRGVTHQKSWSFSKVGQTPYVTMVGSTNLTGYGTEVQYSDMFTYTNRKDVYDAFASVQSQPEVRRRAPGPVRDQGLDERFRLLLPVPRPPPPRPTRSSPGSTRCPRTRTPTSASPSSPGTTRGASGSPTRSPRRRRPERP